MNVIWAALYGLVFREFVISSFVALAVFGAISALFDFLATVHKRRRL